MAAGSTYTPIATTTLGSSQTSYTFSSIPSTYTDIILIASIVTNATYGGLGVRVNGDTGTTYSTTFLYGTGSAAGSNRYSSQTQAYVYDSTVQNQTSPVVYQFQNYANSSTYKTFIGRWNATGSGDNVAASVSLWRNTAAINSITLLSNGAWQAGTQFTLYGIQAA